MILSAWRAWPCPALSGGSQRRQHHQTMSHTPLLALRTPDPSSSPAYSHGRPCLNSAPQSATQHPLPSCSPSPPTSLHCVKACALCCRETPIQCSAQGPAVHVQYSTDPSEYVAMLASIHSALRNSKQPGRLRFHLTIPYSADERALCTLLIQGLQK